MEDPTPFEVSGDYGDEVLRVWRPPGSWAAINRVSVDGALWLVEGEDHDGGGSWSAAPLEEPVMITLAGDELTVAGRAENAVAQIVVELNATTHAATPQADGLWLMLVGSIGDATEVVVRSEDQRGNRTSDTLIELPTGGGSDLASRRSRFRLWLGRGLRGYPRGITHY